MNPNTAPVAAHHDQIPCSCGNTAQHRPHVIAERRPADGGCLCLWSDGAITQHLGLAFPGVPVARPRTPVAARAALAAGWLVMGEVELYDASEIPALYAAAKRIAARGGLPGDLRRAMAARA